MQQPRSTHDAAPPATTSSRARQFAAVLHKNVLLSVRGRRSTFLGGVGGWPALLLQVALPALFFSLMCIPKYYIQPYEHPLFLQASEYDVDTRWWAGASPYEGECVCAKQRSSLQGGGGPAAVRLPTTMAAPPPTTTHHLPTMPPQALPWQLAGAHASRLCPTRPRLPRSFSAWPWRCRARPSPTSASAAQPASHPLPACLTCSRPQWMHAR
jgi:hypothetical protein